MVKDHVEVLLKNTRRSLVSDPEIQELSYSSLGHRRVFSFTIEEQRGSFIDY